MIRVSSEHRYSSRSIPRPAALRLGSSDAQSVGPCCATAPLEEWPAVREAIEQVEVRVKLPPGSY